MKLQYAVGYDRQSSITVGYTTTGPLGDELPGTFPTSDPEVMAKVEELVELICSKHSLMRGDPPVPVDPPA